MKQGRPSRDVSESYKTEPASKAVSPRGVSAIGLQYVNCKEIPVYEGRGLQAPMKSVKTSNKGSQGNY